MRSPSLTFLVVKGASLYDIHYPGEMASVFRDPGLRNSAVWVKTPRFRKLQEVYQPEQVAASSIPCMASIYLFWQPPCSLQMES